MALNLSLQTRECVAWRTERPYVKRFRVSPTFVFQNFSWILKIFLSEKGEYYILLERQLAVKEFHSFHVTTYLEHAVPGTCAPALAQTVTVSHVPLRIWSAQEKEVAESMPDLNDYGEFTVVCVLHRIDDSDKDAAKVLGSPVPADLDFVKGDMVPFSKDLEGLSCDLYKLLESDVFPDVKLKSEDRVFPAHRAVLAARSDVFAAMFRHKMTENETGVVDILDVEATVLELFLKYLYTGKLPDPPEDVVRSLYAVSDKYAVHVLKQECYQRMIKTLNEKNCLDFMKFDVYPNSAFKESAIAFLTNNSSFLQSDAWLKFSEDDPALAIEIYRKSSAKQASEKDRETDPVNEKAKEAVEPGKLQVIGYRLQDLQIKEDPGKRRIMKSKRRN